MWQAGRSWNRTVVENGHRKSTGQARGRVGSAGVEPTDEIGEVLEAVLGGGGRGRGRRRHGNEEAGMLQMGLPPEAFAICRVAAESDAATLNKFSGATSGECVGCETICH